MTGDQHFKDMFLSIAIQLAAARARIDELEEQLAAKPTNPGKAKP